MLRKNAFSLVELSVVLIVIALLAGTVTLGGTLIRQAKIKGFLLEVEDIKAAIGTFVTKYSYLPGDYPDAGKVWSVTDPTCTDAVPNDTTSTGCNGNGNKIWDTSYGYCCYAENYLMWKHLQLAKIIPNVYGGYKLSGTISTDASNTYASRKISGALFIARNIGIPGLTPTGALNRFTFSKITSSYYSATEGVFTPLEMQAMDVKYDDSHPKKGAIMASNHFDVTNQYAGYNEAAKDCTTLENDNTTTQAEIDAATYKLTNELKACEFILESRFTR